MIRNLIASIFVFSSLFMFSQEEDSTSLLLGKNHYKEADYPAAEKEFNKVLLTDAKNYEALKLRGDCKNKQGAYQAALLDYKKASKVNSSDPLLYKSRGAAYMSLGEYESAIDDFEKLIALAPDDAEGYFNRGGALYLLYDLKNSIKDYDKAIALDSDFSEAYYYRGVAKGELQDYVAAKNDINKAIALDSNLSAALFNVAVIDYYAGNLEKALEQFLQLTEDEVPNVGEWYYFIAECYYTLEDKENACDNYKQATINGDLESAVLYDVVCVSGKEKRERKDKRRSSSVSF